MTAINFQLEGKYFCQSCVASSTFTGSVDAACILDKVSHWGHAVNSIASSVSGITDITSIKKI